MSSAVKKCTCEKCGKPILLLLPLGDDFDETVFTSGWGVKDLIDKNTRGQAWKVLKEVGTDKFKELQENAKKKVTDQVAEYNKKRQKSSLRAGNERALDKAKNRYLSDLKEHGISFNPQNALNWAGFGKKGK